MNLFLIQKRNFFNLNKKYNSINRIGPHNIDILSFIIGSILGDLHLEKRNNSLGCKLIIEQCQQNVEYIY
jgi:hypothetical protein